MKQVFVYFWVWKIYLGEKKDNKTKNKNPEIKKRKFFFSSSPFFFFAFDKLGAKRN